MNALVLLTDAFGGHGGIAKYNRDLLRAMCSFPAMRTLVALPRLAPFSPGSLPQGLTFRFDSAGGKARYLSKLAETLGGRIRFDLVLCAHVNLLPLAYIAACRYAAPLHLLTYGIEVWQPSPSKIANLLATRIDEVLSISETTAERFRSWALLSGVPVRILPNAIERSDFGVGPKDEKLLERYGIRGKKVLATLGRLASAERMKGFDEIISLMPRMLKHDPNLVYLVMGDGNDRHRLEEKAQALGVGRAVIFCGPIDETEKAAHYRLADLYVMPSSGEGFGFVFLEALACGIPVVASKRDGGREAVRDGKLGILVDPLDSDDIERGILEGLKRPRGVIPEGLDHFSFDAFVGRTHQWLQGPSSGAS
jgi:glycosyltransferase involved in cell wall biosynthesis